MDKLRRVERIFFAVIILNLFIVSNSQWMYMSKVFALGAKVMCDNIVRLVGKQRQLCQENPDVMTSIGKGARLGEEECQRQFRFDRWNCSTIDDLSVFGKVMRRSNKETAFVHAITSAGVVYEVTRSCSRGELRECNCHRMERSAEQGFKWSGCSENVAYGMHFSRTFIDSSESQQDPQALMNLHNNKVGRRAVRRLMELKCKCHGVSGSCSLKSCSRKMLPFKAVGNLLRKRYLSAIKVTIDQAGKALSKTKRNKKPSREALVYLEESPDYCLRNPTTGSVGTFGRECNRTSIGRGSCAVLCCGRGFDVIERNDDRKCDCKFQWCCYVKCNTCRYKVDKHYCKGRYSAPGNGESSRHRQGDKPSQKKRRPRRINETL